MGIKNTITYQTTAPYGTVYSAVLNALNAAEVAVEDDGNPIIATSKRALRKNRWAAEHTIDMFEGSITWTVDALGAKHDAIRDEILSHLPAGMIDDQGIGTAVEAMGKAGRVFGALEVANLRSIITPTEHVLVAASGNMDKRLGLLVLTSQRVVFFDQGVMSSSVEEFALSAIQSMGFKTRLSGEEVNISISGRDATIKSVPHGQGKLFVDQFRVAQAALNDPEPVAVAPAPAVLDQLRKLGELRDAGVLTQGEFEEKKRALLEQV